MNRIIYSLIGLVILTSTRMVVAQVPNEALANQIIAARQKNAAMMKQYNWNTRTEVIEKGDVKDTRVELVSYGPDGELQRSLITDQCAPLPGGLFRHAAAENKKKEMEKYVKGLAKLLEQYTMSSSGAVINFISAANMQSAQAPDGSAILTLTGNNVLNPGDTFSLTVNPANFQTRRVQISTTFEGDSVNLSATFKTMKSGLTHMQFADVEVPAKQIVLQIHNFDYVSND